MFMVRSFGVICGCFLFPVLSSVGFAQFERFELGKRVHRFEVAWQAASGEDRVRAVEPVSKAVTSFFSLRFLTAAEWIDRAYFTVLHSERPSDFAQWASAQSIVLDRKLFDRDGDPFRLKIEPFYSTIMARPSALRVRVALRSLHEMDRDEIVLIDDAEFNEEGWSFPLNELLEGDYRLMVRMTSEGELWEMPTATMSVAIQVQDRLMKLTEAAKDKNRWESGTLRSSLRAWTQLLRNLSTEAVQETDFPSVSLLHSAERLVAHPNDVAAAIRLATTPSGIWMNLVSENKALPVRFRIPKDKQGPFPVLVAYHGAGGSENMFFETYGAGRTIDLAIERGWLVVCPRQGLLGLSLDVAPMLDELAKIVPIDKGRLFLLGHSMGAAQLIQQATTHPVLPKAVAALGGGRGISKVSPDMNFPWFVGAGEQDFGRGGARALTSSLEKNGKLVTYREYPHVEHLVIVQAALDDVFHFFDQWSN